MSGYSFARRKDNVYVTPNGKKVICTKREAKKLDALVKKMETCTCKKKMKNLTFNFTRIVEKAGRRIKFTQAHRSVFNKLHHPVDVPHSSGAIVNTDNYVLNATREFR